MGTKLPIGIQSFEKIRTDDFLYVDKTEYIYKLVHNNIPYFLSRPRRFGKSLLLSTFKAYWEGKRELFNGLAIEGLDIDNSDSWNSYPVFYMDFNGQNYSDTSIESVIDGMFKKWESEYGETREDASFSDRFEQLIVSAEKKTGRRVVILVDEYDKALLETSEDKGRQEHIKSVFKGLFGVLKKADEHLQFVFISGVTKFHKVSIFSDLNQLRDISLSPEFSGICGVTEEELFANFGENLNRLASENDMSMDECVAKLRDTYDGYHFGDSKIGVYNPFSLLNSLEDNDFSSYWFTTGTPSFLVKTLRAMCFDVSKFSTNNIYVGENNLKDYSGDGDDIIPLLYQTGYLTILDYDKTKRRYSLGFPNSEVRYGFLESLLSEYSPHSNAGYSLDIFSLEEYIESSNLDKIRDVIKGLFADITYTSNDVVFEHYFQTVIYLVFTLLGKFVECERHTSNGRIDCLVKTNDYIYLFEFKRDDTADAALKQIEEQGYANPFVADLRKLYKIGASFSSDSRRLEGWKVVE